MRLLGLVVTGVSLALLLSDSSAAGGSARPPFGPLLFAVAVLVLAAKAGGVLAERAGQPPVLGELVAGICLGNLAFAVPGTVEFARTSADPTLAFLGQVGVLVLLFEV